MAKTTQKKKQNQGPVADLLLSVYSSFNNTIITASALHTGAVLAWTSSGMVGFKGAKKGTPYAATTAMKSLLEKLAAFKPETAVVVVSGAGNGRDAALRALTGSGLKVTRVHDKTPLPHNGCRPKKARRV
ncbi:MAG TPA: 30S ribosomal protein S11 [Candidatus Saccharimonadales bacterium]|nr:30S ribosomal protein S11 [Candidatus Saccharimonadales bacterium]